MKAGFFVSAFAGGFPDTSAQNATADQILRGVPGEMITLAGVAEKEGKPMNRIDAFHALIAAYESFLRRLVIDRQNLGNLSPVKNVQGAGGRAWLTIETRRPEFRTSQVYLHWLSGDRPNEVLLGALEEAPRRAARQLMSADGAERVIRESKVLEQLSGPGSGVSRRSRWWLLQQAGPEFLSSPFVQSLLKGGSEKPP